MADVRISGLPAAQVITGTELVPVVQNGLTVQTTVAAITASPSLTQPFLTVSQQSTLPNSRYFSTGAGIGITDGGAQGAYTIRLNGTSGSLETAGTGIVVKTAASTITARSFAVSGSGLSLANGSGVSGDPTLSLSGLALALANTVGTGLLAVNGSALTPLTITGTSNQITVTNGNGASGNPIISITSNPVLLGTAAVQVPSGTTAQRAGAIGSFRLNLDTGLFEGYNGSWNSFAAGSGVTSVATGTGLTGGLITSTGTISIDSTVVTLTGTQTLTNKTISGANNALSNIANGSLTNSSITINGNAVSLGGSTTVTAAAPFALTIGTGLSGSSYNGSSAVTVAIASTTVTAAAYGSASSVANFTVNAQGQLTAAASTPIAIAASQVTSGTLAIAQGGTNSSATPTNGGVGYGTGTAYAFSAAGTSSQVLTSAGAASPTWTSQSSLAVGTSTNLAGGATGSLSYQSGVGATTFLPTSTNGYILTLTAGLPSWQPAPASGVTTFSAGTTGLTPSTATSGAVTLAGTLALANGGTNASLTAVAGAVPYSSASALALTAAGTAGQVLTSTGATAPTWSGISGGTF